MLENITSIDGNEFGNNKVLENVTMSDNMQSFNNDSVFLQCSNLKTCRLSDSIKVIPNFLFQKCTSLQEVNIPESTVEIGQYAFAGIQTIEKITIPESVRKIGIGAFSGMGESTDSKLQEIIIKEGVEEIEERAFANEKSVKVELHLPSTLKVEKIGKNAFAGYGKNVYLHNGTQYSTKWI